MKITAGISCVVAAAALVAVTGCGSSGGGSGGTASATSPAASSSAAISSTPAQQPSPATPSAASVGPSGTSATVVITIRDFAYQGPDSVSPGVKVTVKNEDAQAHTVTSDQGALFDAVVPGGGGTTVFTAPKNPGSYAYHCTYHGNMHGTLIVK